MSGTGNIVVVAIEDEFGSIEPLEVNNTANSTPKKTCEETSAPRKKKLRPETWKRNVEKEKRYSPKGFPKMPTCNHNGKSFRCRQLCMQDVRRIHQAFYKDKSLLAQNNFILRHVRVTKPKRSTGKRKFSTDFVLPKTRGGVSENVSVCRQAFLSILQVGRDRLQRLCANIFVNPETPTEKRGEDRQSEKFAEKKAAVKAHIKKIVPLESHYSRAKNCDRQYLSSELSIVKMHGMFIEEFPEIPIKYEYYRRIFCHYFNIGFGAPSVDTCSTCASLITRIETGTAEEEKEELVFEFKAHKKRAEVFYKKLEEDEENTLTLSYDCQKNLVLPKLPDQAAYYLRQMYLFNFTVCQGHSHSSQTPENVYSYVWLETDFAKASSQIASAVHHNLTHKSDFGGKTRIRLFADGCGGQNKNKSMIGMLMHWLLNEAPATIGEIEMWFPIVGHSFIPPDRVFGNLEREFRKIDVIEKSEIYTDIMKKHATVIRLGEEHCPVREWKLYADTNIKDPGGWHFQFQKAKKNSITKTKNGNSCLVKGEPFYNFEGGAPKSLNKRGKNIKNQRLPTFIPRGVLLKSKKVGDIQNLLRKRMARLGKFNFLCKYDKRPRTPGSRR